MIRSLARSFVVTIAAVSSVGCQKEADPIHAENPRPNSSDTSVTTATATATPTVTATAKATATATATAIVMANPPSIAPTRKRKRTSAAPATYKYPPGPAPNWSDLEAKNPTDADGRTLYVDSSDTCYVEVPPKALPKTPMPPGLRMMDHLALDCPAIMDDPAWDECAYGPLMKNKSKPECYCMALGGNPPPPPRLVACPKK